MLVDAQVDGALLFASSCPSQHVRFLLYVASVTSVIHRNAVFSWSFLIVI